MTWFKETVEDWDLVGQAMARREQRDVVRSNMHKFNPDEVALDEDGNLFVVQEAVDSVESIELEQVQVIEVGSEGIENKLDLDEDTLKAIKGD